MVKGLYTGYTGMVNSQKRLDVISNNLANAKILRGKGRRNPEDAGAGKRKYERAGLEDRRSSASDIVS